MSAFDMTINVGRTAIAIPEAEAVKAGEAPNALDVILTVVQGLPFQQPGKPPVVVPLGNVKFSIARDQAIQFFKTGLEQAEALPPESRLTVASDLSDAEVMSQGLDGIRNGS